jgi:glycosyltransferase involved in cell wall biosynthesis
MTIVKMLLSNPFVFDPRVLTEARALVSHGYDVEVLGWDRECKYSMYAEVDGIKVRRVRRKATFRRGLKQSLHFLGFWRDVLCELRRARMDVIHCHDMDTLLPGVLLARVTASKLIYDAHENYPATFSMRGGPCVSRVLGLMERVLIKRVDAVITVGQLLADRLRAITSRPVFVVGNWKNPLDYQIDPERIQALAEQTGIDGRLVISYIGGLNRDRIFRPLIEAVKNYPRVFLIVAGDGYQRDDVKRLLQEMDNAIYLGQIPLADVPQYVVLSDVLYYGLDARSPNNQFSAPNALFTALAAGKAVLTTSVGEIAQIVREEDCGIVLDAPSVPAIESALERLASPAFLRQCQQNAARAGQTRYNWDSAQRILLSIYEDLTPGRVRRSA